MRNKSDPATSVEHLLKSGVEMREILAQIACTNTALRLAARRLAHLYDEALAATERKATQVSLLAEIERLTDGDGPAVARSGWKACDPNLRLWFKWAPRCPCG
jgi:hypothetical protein